MIEALAHDYLWCVHGELPPGGAIGVFDVLERLDPTVREAEPGLEELVIA